MAVANTTLTTAREIVELLAIRLPGGEVAAGTDNLKRLDYAIKAAGDEFVRRTKCVRKTNSSLTLTADSEAFSTSSITDFHPDRLIKIEVNHPDTDTKYPALRVSYDEVRNWRLYGFDRTESYPYANGADLTGVPCVFGWKDATSAIVAPLPSIAWEIFLTYWEPFTSWTIGTATPNSVTLNIPDDVIMPVLQHGAAFYLNKAASPAAASMDRSLFEKHIIETRGNYGVTKFIQAQEADYR